MESWKYEFFKGKRCLASKDLRAALKHLYLSIKECPVERESDLADIFYNLGVAFRKLGCMIPAIRSWDASMCADRGGAAAEILNSIFPGKRLDNDRSYFYLIQLSLYLSRKKSGKMDSEAEKDMILDLISVYWEQIVDSGILHGQCQTEKIIIFKDIEIDFPYVGTNSGFSVSELDTIGHIIPFRANKR